MTSASTNVMHFVSVVVNKHRITEQPAEDRKLKVREYLERMP